MPVLNPFQSALYQRLQAFELDDPTHEFGFTRHLMRNNGWTQSYAERAIAEYKKFAFLTVVANHQVVPSDQVDQVWHAHVLLTQSYWEEFCPKVLGKKLHHDPTRGGRLERAKFHHLYAQTIASYRQFFGSPPTDIWSPPDVRFGAELKMQRVSLSNYWLIPKRLPRLKLAQPLSIIAIIVCMITVGWASLAQGATLGLRVDDGFVNQSVMVFYSSPVLGLILRYIIRSPSKQPQKPELDTYQIAYLAGGASRVVELVITQLVDQGYLHPHVNNRTFAIKKQLPPKATLLEQQVMRQVDQTPALKDLYQVENETSFIQKFLAQEKLLITGWGAFMAVSFKFFIVLSFTLLFFGGILIALVTTLLDIQLLGMEAFQALYLSVGIVTCCCFTPNLCTRWGSRILADIRKTHDAYDKMQRFALFGYPTLSGGVLDDLRQIFKAETEAITGGCACGC